MGTTPKETKKISVNLRALARKRLERLEKLLGMNQTAVIHLGIELVNDLVKETES